MSAIFLKVLKMIIIAAVVLCVVLAICFLTNPADRKNAGDDIPGKDVNFDTDFYFDTDFSQNLYDAITEDWEKYNAMDSMQKMASSHMPGYCSGYFDSWDELTDYVGTTPLNPLENDTWLEATKDIRIANRTKNSMYSPYRTEFYGDSDGKLRSLKLEGDYPFEMGHVQLIINVYSDMDHSAWSDDEESGVVYKHLSNADFRRVHSDRYDAVEIALPGASDFRYLFNIVSYNGTDTLAEMVQKVCQAIGVSADLEWLE